MSDSNVTIESNVAEADTHTTYPGLALLLADTREADRQSPALEPPVLEGDPESCPGSPQRQVVSLLNAINQRLNFLWVDLVARFRSLVEVFLVWPTIILFELPRLFITGLVLIVTVSWLSVSLTFNVFVELLTTTVAWTILACYLCAFSLHATWITLKNVAVARRGQLTIREVLDSINGHRTLDETSAASTAISYEKVYSLKPTSMDEERENNENIPPEHHHAIPKPYVSKSSRALHVLSSITHTFSRSSLSLASFKSSRNFSGASAASSAVSAEQKPPKPSTSSSASARRPLIPRFDTQSTATPGPPESVKATSPPQQPAEQESPASGPSEPVELDPRLVYTAQPSAYWTGRFITLSDLYHNELLEPETLHVVLEEHKRRANPEKHLSEDNTATTTAPFTKSASVHGDPSHPSNNPPKATPNPRQPATVGPSSRTSTSHARSRPPLSGGLSRIPFHKAPSSVGSNSTSSTAVGPRRQSFDPQNRQMAPPPPPPTTIASASDFTSSPQPATATAATSAAQRKQTILLASDDARRRRVLAALAALCATPDAAASLREWQTALARRTGNETLLPEGARMLPLRRQQGRWGGRSSRSGKGAWGREDGGSVVSESAGSGLVSRLRLFGGRRSRVEGPAESEPGAMVGGEAERRMKVKRVRRVDGGQY